MPRSMKGLLPIIFMIAGGLIGDYARGLTPIIPYIISAMLFMTFLSVRPLDIVWKRSHFYLLGLHIVLGIIGYIATYPLGSELQNAALICLMMPAATASPAIVQALGGRPGYVIGYILLSHIFIVLIAPSIFPYLNTTASSDFWQTARSVLHQIFNLVMPAILLAWGLRYLFPNVMKKISSKSGINIGLWYLSLVLLMAHIVSTSNIMMHTERFIAGIACGLICCVVQFAAGQWMGLRLDNNNHTAIRHALGQKNTTLGIWLASMYLSPYAVIAAASYVVWQNVLISYFLARQQS